MNLFLPFLFKILTTNCFKLNDCLHIVRRILAIFLLILIFLPELIRPTFQQFKFTNIYSKLNWSRYYSFQCNFHAGLNFFLPFSVQQQSQGKKLILLILRIHYIFFVSTFSCLISHCVTVRMPFVKSVSLPLTGR